MSQEPKPAPALTLASISKITDADAALRKITEAADEMRSLEQRAELVFDHWTKAQELAHAAGISVDLEVNAGMAAHLSEFKQRASRREAQKIAKEELGN